MSVLLRRTTEVAPAPCPCGTSRRLITRADTPLANLHVTSIRNASLHFHKKTTEFYYILEGSGRMQVGDDEFDLEPGVIFMVEPNVPHRGSGDFDALIVGVPAIEPDDEYMAEQQ